MSLEFDNIRHAYGARPVLDGVSLVARPGEITCLLGPSGCGKTTLLRLAAGLLNVSSGEIRLGDAMLARPTFNPPPEKRPVGLVFQEGALFGHLTVAENVAFGLSGRAERGAVTQEVLEQVGMAGFEARYPHMLSGGQQQRVALARALAPEPQVLLLDEPFASIDIVMRRSLREEMRRVLKERACVALLVTHDPEEAVEIADHIVVMGEGRIVQAGSPDALFDRPEALSVGTMIGGGQHVPCEVQDGCVRTVFGDWPLSALTSAPAKGEADLLVRPTSLVVEREGANTLADIRVSGEHARLVIAAPNGRRLHADVPRPTPFVVGDQISVEPAERSAFAFAR